jgi:hypothetical protein
LIFFFKFYFISLHSLSPPKKKIWSFVDSFFNVFPSRSLRHLDQPNKKNESFIAFVWWTCSTEKMPKRRRNVQPHLDNLDRDNNTTVNNKPKRHDTRTSNIATQPDAVTKKSERHDDDRIATSATDSMVTTSAATPPPIPFLKKLLLAVTDGMPREFVRDILPLIIEFVGPGTVLIYSSAFFVRWSPSNPTVVDDSESVHSTADLVLWSDRVYWHYGTQVYAINSCETGPVIPISSCPHYYRMWQSAAVDPVTGIMYVTGGRDDLSRVQSTTLRFHLSSQQWLTQALVMPMALRNHKSIVNNHQLYVMGGIDSNRCFRLQLPNTLNYVEFGGNNKWEVMASMSEERANCASTRWKNGVLIIGGRGPDCLGSNTCEWFSLDTEQWVAFPSTKFARLFSGACVVDEQLFVFGNFDNGQRRTPIEQFHELMQIWVVLPGSPLFTSCCVVAV